MKIALAQLNYTIGDFESNMVKIIGAITRAKSQGADLVVFSEQAVSGAPAYDLLNKVSFLDLCEEALVEIASACDGISALVGLPLQATGNKTISGAALLADRKVKAYIGKRTVDSRDELFHLTPSKGCQYVNVGGVKVGVVVGKDIRTQQEYGEYADLVVCLANNHYARAVIERRYETLRRRAYQIGKPMIMVNSLGGNTDVVYDGSSAAFNARGEAIALLKSFEEDFQVIDTEQSPALEIPYQDKTVNVYRAIRLGLDDYFRKNDFETACIPVSGGIDSSVVAAIATEVLGPERVKLLHTPSQFTSRESIDDVRRLAGNLGVECFRVPINDVFMAHTHVLGPILGEKPFDVTEENIQVRIRAVMLYALANRFDYIVLNTTNKSANAVGFGTLYGSSVGALSILGDLYKTEVFDLARYINRHGEIIPSNIITKAPSAELRPNQKDTDSLPPYDILDAILYRMIEEGQSREEIVNAGFESDDVYRVYDMVVRSEHKRRQACPTLRLSTRTLGIDRILPLTNRYGY